MTTQLIELDTTGTLTEYSVIVELSEIEYLLSFRWNRVGAFWTVDLATTAGEAILTGQTVIQYRNLLTGTQVPGSLYFMHSQGLSTLADIATLGTDVKLYYSYEDA